MEYIAIAVLVALIFIAVGVVRIYQAVTEFINGRLTVHLSQIDRDLLTNFRRRKPAVKKETV